MAEAAEDRKEARAAEVEGTVDEMPGWFLNPPKDDGISLYGAGTAVSTDVQLGIDKAVLTAKRAIADRLGSTISARLKAFVAESGSDEDPTVSNEIESVATNVIKEVDVSGYLREETEVITNQGKYRLYVLLRYPLEKANSVLVSKAKSSQVLESRLQASKAFKELESEIERARQSR